MMSELSESGGGDGVGGINMVLGHIASLRGAGSVRLSVCVCLCVCGTFLVRIGKASLTIEHHCPCAHSLMQTDRGRERLTDRQTHTQRKQRQQRSAVDIP